MQDTKITCRIIKKRPLILQACEEKSFHFFIQIEIKQIQNQSKTSPRFAYSLFSLYQPQRVCSPPQNRSKETERLCPRYCSSVHLQCHLREHAKAIQRKLCPCWKRTDVIKAVSCCRARKPTPTTWNYLNHATASREGGQKSMERTTNVRAKWGFDTMKPKEERRVYILTQ